VTNFCEAKIRQFQLIIISLIIGFFKEKVCIIYRDYAKNKEVKGGGGVSQLLISEQGGGSNYYFYLFFNGSAI